MDFRGEKAMFRTILCSMLLIALSAGTTVLAQEAGSGGPAGGVGTGESSGAGGTTSGAGGADRTGGTSEAEVEPVLAQPMPVARPVDLWEARVEVGRRARPVVLERRAASAARPATQVQGPRLRREGRPTLERLEPVQPAPLHRRPRVAGPSPTPGGSADEQCGNDRRWAWDGRRAGHRVSATRGGSFGGF